MSAYCSRKANSLQLALTFDLSTRNDLSSQTLLRLLQRNHETFAVLREPRLLFHNHLPHALGSAYLLGASSALLEEIYDHEAPELARIEGFETTHITPENWRDYLTSKDQTVALVNFFEREFEKNGRDWKAVVQHYLFQGSEPLINGFSGGLGHPFIHLAYAYEFESIYVASEAMSEGCTEYDFTHRYLDRRPDDNSTYKTRRLEDILRNIQSDTRLHGLFEQPGFANIASAFAKRESTILEHWNAWILDDPLSQLEECMHTASLVAICTGDSAGEFDFYLAHVLTVGHALRVLLPLMKADQCELVMRQFGLYAIAIYIAQLQPSFSHERIEAWVSTDCDWSSLSKRALGNKSIVDVHFPKVVRALRATEETWGRKGGIYLKAASKFVTEFKQWNGFGLGVDAIA